MLWEEIYQGDLAWLQDRTVLLMRSGSHAYGLNTPESDLDVKGVCIPPRKYFLGFLNHFEQAESHSPLDLTIFDIRKFFKLCADCNPNIIEMLFTDASDMLLTHSLGRRLLEHREAFLSRKARHTFSGYAMAQLKRIRTHRRWLISPPTHKPSRAEFNLPETNILDGSLRGAIESLAISSDWTPEMLEGQFGSLVMDAYQRERAYHNKLTEWGQFENWKKTRNPKRAALEARVGHDCYVEDTEFLTRSGWKDYDAVTEVDELATVYIGPTLTQHRQFAVEYQAYTERFEGIFMGNLYHLNAHHTEVSVTPNHRMLIRKVERRSGKESSWQLIEATHLPDTFDVLRTISPRVTAFSFQEQFRELPVPPTAYMRLMGWYLTDGSAAFRKKAIRGLRISQKQGGKLHGSMTKFHRKYHGVARTGLYSCLRKPTKFRPYEITEIILSVTNVAIRERMVGECGWKKNKRIPRWVFGLSKRLMGTLLNAMAGGDGTVRQTSLKSLVIYSSLKSLADDIQELAFHCGWETTLWGPYKDREVGVMYQVHVNKNTERTRRLIRHNNITTTPVTNQRIVCFSVPNGVLVTRVNGKIGLHGNSKHSSHLVRLLKMGREILTTGQVIVKRKEDREEILAIKNGAWSYDQVVEFAEREDAAMAELEKTSPLPHSPDRVKLDILCDGMVAEALEGGL